MKEQKLNKEELLKRVEALENCIVVTTKELEETKEALERSRKLRKTILSSIKSPGFPSLEERARKLFSLFIPDYTLNEASLDEWMQKVVDINS